MTPGEVAFNIAARLDDQPRITGAPGWTGGGGIRDDTTLCAFADETERSDVVMVQAMFDDGSMQQFRVTVREDKTIHKHKR
jgi:hypothetical protein